MYVHDSKICAKVAGNCNVVKCMTISLRTFQVMGHGLKGLPRDQVILATKVGRYDKAKFDFSAATVTQSVHDSLKRLQVDYIDLIQTHDIEFGDLDQVGMPVLPSPVHQVCRMRGHKVLSARMQTAHTCSLVMPVLLCICATKCSSRRSCTSHKSRADELHVCIMMHTGRVTVLLCC